MSPYEIPWEDAFWERRREDYDSGVSWAIPVIDVADEEDEDLDEEEEEE